MRDSPHRCGRGPATTRPCAPNADGVRRGHPRPTRTQRADTAEPTSTRGPNADAVRRGHLRPTRTQPGDTAEPTSTRGPNADAVRRGPVRPTRTRVPCAQRGRGARPTRTQSGPRILLRPELGAWHEPVFRRYSEVSCTQVHLLLSICRLSSNHHPSGWAAPGKVPCQGNS